MKALWIVAIAVTSALSFAAEYQPPTHVKNLGGCFTVSYRFVENGTNDYEIPKALEWITVKPGEKPDTHVVQHYGLFDDGEIMKHFYEVWSPSAVGWKQEIYGPFGGAVRYTCESTLRHGQMRCESKASPKPQRDKKRKDYDLLNRGTMIQITPKGWVQSEINDKVTRAGGVVSTELGWVEYRRTADEKPCEAAAKQYPNG